MDTNNLKLGATYGYDGSRLLDERPIKQGFKNTSETCNIIQRLNIY